jgi:hypothetical protein
VNGAAASLKAIPAATNTMPRMRPIGDSPRTTSAIAGNETVPVKP